MKNINIAIFGSTGYIGLELIRLLQAHPYFNIQYLYGPQHTGKKLSELCPHLSGVIDLAFTDLSASKVAEKSDLVFLCLPHGVTRTVMPDIFGKAKIIDLSGDFRHDSAETYLQWYGKKHSSPEIISEFIYCIPEIHLNKNKLIMKKLQAVPEVDESKKKGGASRGKNFPLRNNIANSGCFASTIQLALFPIKNFIQKTSIMAITGSSGSGKNASLGTHHPLRSHNLKSYNVGVHQHTPEICQTLNLDTNNFQFVPTSGPFVRGIFATCFVDLNQKVSLEIIKNIYQETYQDSPFIRIKDTVQLVDVIGSNFCDLSIKQVNDQIVIQVCLDNLIKGAGGNAIQNANVMFDLDQTTGLNNLSPLFP